jgi:histidine triad (HIT) family protein
MTLFTKIITGQIGCEKIYEDDLTFAFLDIEPHTLGHTLIVPKIEVGDFVDLPQKYVNRIFENAQKIGKAIEKATGCKRLGLMVQGFGVPDHFHLHICGINSPRDLDQSSSRQETRENLLKIQAKILEHLN